MERCIATSRGGTDIKLRIHSSILRARNETLVEGSADAKEQQVQPQDLGTTSSWPSRNAATPIHHRFQSCVTNEYMVWENGTPGPNSGGE